MAQIQDFADHLTGKTKTYEGGVGYKTNLRETIAEFFSLGLLNGMFYQTQEQVMEGAVEIFQKALAECPEFAAKAAIYGHTVNSLKLVPTIWLVYLSTLENKALFNRAFPKIITNINLLHDFMEICRKAPIRKGLGRSVKRTFNKRLQELLNEYSVSRNKTTIGELIKVSRPHFEDEKLQAYMRYVSKGELSFERAQKLKWSLEKIRANEIDEELLAAVEQYALQLEELKHAINNFSISPEQIKQLVTAIANEKDMEKVAQLQAKLTALKEKEMLNLSAEKKQLLYGTLYKRLRYAALILNLVALERVFAKETKQVKALTSRGRISQNEVLTTDIPDDIKHIICAKISDINQYRSSNILPFALLNAQKKVKTEEFRTAIEQVLNTCAKEAFSIPPELELLVGVDTSGSMSIMVNDSLSAADISTFLGALIKIAHPATTVCSVATSCEEVAFKQENLFGLAKDIADTDVGGGTSLELLMQHYTGQKYVLLLTDSEQANDIGAKWLKAKKPDGARLIVWQLQAYQTKVSNALSVLYLAGYSDRLLALVKNIIEEKGTQIEEIEKIEV
ncbi:ribonucleoprotein [Spirochaetia bacterium]|nr:ribonucleoprotein [Spirochaetia bacterium]